MYCPVCESEYEKGVTRCPDHDVELEPRGSQSHQHGRVCARTSKAA